MKDCKIRGKINDTTVLIDFDANGNIAIYNPETDEDMIIERVTRDKRSCQSRLVTINNQNWKF